jgi:hypothetical protein
LSAGEGFDYPSLYQFVAEVIEAGNDQQRPVYFTPDFDGAKVKQGAVDSSPY